jgi:hypothetical protein
LIMGTELLHKLRKPFINNWGNNYEGDDVVKGLYHKCINLATIS